MRLVRDIVTLCVQRKAELASAAVSGSMPWDDIEWMLSEIRGKHEFWAVLEAVCSQHSKVEDVAHWAQEYAILQQRAILGYQDREESWRTRARWAAVQDFLKQVEAD